MARIWLRPLQALCVIAAVTFISMPQLVADYPGVFTAVVLAGIVTGILSFADAARQSSSKSKNETPSR
jgi:hypothetical protein